VKTYSGGVALASVERSGFVEGYHRGSVVVLSATGDVVASAGDITGPIFPRSSNKPFQAIGMLRHGLPVTDPADLAVIAASHFGEDFHITRIRKLLGDLESSLQCPPDHPLSNACLEPQRIYMNCSGKHTGMLLTCVANGWSTADYYEPEHPLQVALHATIEELTGESIAAVGVDGCGAPCAAVSLTGLANGFLRIAADPIADAMRAYPENTSGTKAEDNLLMRAVPGLFSKGGAEGVWAAAVSGVGAVALKIDDGHQRARGPVMVAALSRLGIEVDVPELVSPDVKGRGMRVGGVHVTWA
jgi:L-asparaginase II